MGGGGQAGAEKSEKVLDFTKWHWPGEMELGPVMIPSPRAYGCFLFTVGITWLSE
jgi:hypothetical protein